ncbi:hypothetical protein EJ08DRAFT_671737 [Tothia fuscella]|uniref:Phosphatidylinositol N-acetylglucosaminyltransferase subunit H conserved domain-containing protein n=1 Tax=Tothia fuscella TaxID=1048955 RepID=A0A9P4TWN7_9PEZI|nr:hypothetical protein EJ08DRAFT_671737 [Tothia fuscella]
MPPPPSALRITRPTPTTISFTVSTRAPLETISARVLHYLSLALRVVIASAILFLLWTKWELLYPSVEGGGVPKWLVSSWPGKIATLMAKGVMTRYLVPLAGGVLWLCARRGYTEESLLVLRGLGIQTTSSSSTYLSTNSTRFIPTTSIQDIFIHEAFKMFEVRFYLAIVVEGEQDVVVVFPSLLPSLTILEEVWRGARSCLYEPKT